MPSRRSTLKSAAPWLESTELVGIKLTLSPFKDCTLYPQYTVGLHAWLLDQVRQQDPDLSAYLHDGESEKPFTLSGLGRLAPAGQVEYSLVEPTAQTPYCWTITALSQPLVAWLAEWLQQMPQTLDLRGAPMHILDWEISHPATTYSKLLDQPIPASPTVVLSFLSPTSFRRRKHHFPLPVPVNLFHSYLRRWNDFSGLEYDPEDFLDWIEDSVMIQRHQLQSVKTVAGKRGSVTGFTGAIELGLAKTALSEPTYVQLFLALGQLAPYCGTGHKTTFGLGQTRLGWTAAPETVAPPHLQNLLAQRIALLTEQFLTQRKRTGGQRATHTAETWATILARREIGESLQDIAEDLEMRYETVKTYTKLARRALRSE
jgi:CRISPR-associated endoribonuclease Cas6